MSAADRAVRCHACGEVLGQIKGDRSGNVGNRIVATVPGVRLFLDLRMTRIEVHCPACGACGRTIGRESFRGVVAYLPEEAGVA